MPNNKRSDLVKWFQQLTEVELSKLDFFNEYPKIRGIIRRSVKAYVKSMSPTEINKIISFFDLSIRLIVLIREALVTERRKK